MGGSDERALRLYDEFARSCDPEDFWGQVKRTVSGQPVDANQIAFIVQTVTAGLALQPRDILLDLCCGNGALTDRIFDHCAGGLGVDVSNHLINIARKNFERIPERRYLVSEVATFAAAAEGTEQFTKALCYGSFKYLDNKTAQILLTRLHQRFPKVERFYIGNNADKSLMHDFFYAGAYTPGAEDAHDSFLGMWRTEDEFKELASSSGWSAAFSRMPKTFYAAKFCYDVILTRSASG